MGSYTWTIWSSGSGGCMTPHGNGSAAFKATWNNAGDFLAREGLQWNSTQSYTQIGNIVATYSYTKSGSAGGYSFIGIYGWSENPLHEYYIVDDWFGGGSPPTGGGQMMGSYTLDGGTYNVYTHTQTNQPAITGTATFVQFFSIRQSARTCGTISLSQHFAQWTKLGMNLGNMEEAKLLVEAGGGSGSIDYSVGTMTVGGSTALEPVPETMPEVTPAGAAFNAGAPGILSIVSLDGSVLRSVRQASSQQAIVPTANLPKGLYLLRFQGDASAPQTRKLLVQ
ncbi:MAG TPA: glycoside hydrolase family 11 protein [Fibrobacteria bacterium]|nr:glycoside hydrolase family 11 protein [Fibrobacteria bacterium]